MRGLDDDLWSGHEIEAVIDHGRTVVDGHAEREAGAGLRVGSAELAAVLAGVEVGVLCRSIEPAETRGVRSHHGGGLRLSVPPAELHGQRVLGAWFEIGRAHV